MYLLDGKRALVCGGSQGIGKATAVAFAAAGAQVAVLARDIDHLTQVVEALPGSGHTQLAADFFDPDGAVEAVQGYLESQGPIHILVNNTGGPPGGPLVAATEDEFMTAFTAHLVTSHRLVQEVLPGMQEAGFGRILNIISTSVKQPIRGLGVSNTIRGAMASWAKTLAGEVGPWGVTVNNVLPGATVTSRHHALVAARAHKSGVTVAEVEEAMRAEIPLGRFAEPEEVAAALLFLASPAASYITGINLPVDGGRLGTL